MPGPVKAWLETNPRFHLHFIPTHSSWLNEAEGWSSILTTRPIKRGSHSSIAELESAIIEFLDVWNEDPTPFKWTKSADEILENVARYCNRTLTAHQNFSRGLVFQPTRLNSIRGGAMLDRIVHTKVPPPAPDNPCAPRPPSSQFL